VKVERHPVIPDILILTPSVYRDPRGYFLETHRAKDLLDHGVAVEFVQGNLSSSLPWVLRGMHYQVNQPQGKLKRCVMGGIYDVAVDLRRGSPTLGKWVGMHLDEHHARAWYIPPGFANGFLTLAQPAKVQYECTTYYEESWARSIAWNDPDLNIQWPLKPGEAPMLSQRDRMGSAFRDAELFEYAVAA
jgi:dTDP-4-dehydrorhamnose 3,5-epimerase